MLWLAAPYCDPTCPRNVTGHARDCECGGAQHHLEMHRQVGACPTCRGKPSDRCNLHRGIIL